MNIGLCQEHRVDHVDDAVDTFHVGTIHVDVLVAPADVETCEKSDGKIQ